MNTYTTDGTHTYTKGPAPTVGDCFTVARSPHTAYNSRNTSATHGRNVTPGTSTRYFDWRLAHETEQAAYAQYLPIREYGTPERNDAFELWMDACEDETAAYQAYQAEASYNV